MAREHRPPPGLHILALNCGSSSLKFALYRTGDNGTLSTLAAGAVEAIGGDGPARFRAETARPAVVVDEPLPAATPVDAVLRITRMLTESGLPLPDAIGHRVVHGGPALHKHCRIDAGTRSAIVAAGALAPLHAPASLAVIDSLGEAFPHCPQFACFDTVFHAAMPELAQRLPLSLALHEAGIRRYGFHGLSCESILHQLDSPLPKRIIVAHLGSGSSITAILDGQSIDTSMALTPGGGVPMATRSGDLDPGVLLWLLRDPGWTAARIEALVERESGLLGVSGTSGDLRRLQAISADDPRARLAIAIYCSAVAKQVAAMITALGGLDLLVFTGGIGEHNPPVRGAICDRLDWFGIVLDPQRNAEAGEPLSADGSRARVLVLPSREELQIARHTAALLTG